MSAPTQPSYSSPEGQYPAPPRQANAGRGFTIAGGICAVLALAILPPVLGVVALVLGIVGYRKGDRAGMYVAIAAVVCAVLGMVIGAAVLSSMRS
jgi:hypothetical protein